MIPNEGISLKCICNSVSAVLQRHFQAAGKYRLTLFFYISAAPALTTVFRDAMLHSKWPRLRAGGADAVCKRFHVCPTSRLGPNLCVLGPKTVLTSFPMSLHNFVM